MFWRDSQSIGPSRIHSSRRAILSSICFSGCRQRVIGPVTSFLQIQLSSARSSVRMTACEISGEILLQQIDGSVAIESLAEIHHRDTESTEVAQRNPTATLLS